MAGGGFRWAAKRAYLELVRRLPDGLAVNLDYFRVFGAFPDLNRPRRFSEKIQHLNLRDRDARMPTLVDKVAVKDYVSTAWASNGSSPRFAFALAFVLLALNQALTTLLYLPLEERSWLYLLRFAAFSVIIVAILGKNFRKSSGA